MSGIETALKTLDHEVNKTVWGDGTCRVSRAAIRLLMSDHARLTALLTPPTDAELREVVERLTDFIEQDTSEVWGDRDAIRTILRALAAKEAECDELMKKLHRTEEQVLEGICCDSETDMSDIADTVRDFWQPRAESAEAKLKRVMEWMHGRCECCEHYGKPTCKPGKEYTPPKALEGE